MKLQIKFALYNAISKALIIGAIAFFLPLILKKVVYQHIDQRLRARLDMMMNEVQHGGINQIVMDQDCSFDDYNIFKEQYVSISPLNSLPSDFQTVKFFNAERNIENVNLKHRVLSKSFLFDNQLYEIEIGEGLSSIDQLTNILHGFSLWFLLVVVIISFFIDIGYARLLLQPFYKIVNEKLQSSHHPSSFKNEKIHTNTYEFAYLDESINEMMKKVKDAFQTEKEFITNVSHEILTPISILQNRIENILNEPDLKENIAMKMVESQKTLVRLSKVVRALLYISKIENDQFLKNETVSVKSLAIDVVKELEDRIQARNIQVAFEWNADYEMQSANRSLLHTMLFNIVSNSIKYNKEGGSIMISGQLTDDHFALSITDTGVGMSQEQLPFIFDRFKRFRPDDEISYGLGLPIVKSIADFHGIKIQVDSEVDKGTTFSFLFPAKATQLLANEATS